MLTGCRADAFHLIARLYQLTALDLSGNPQISQLPDSILQLPELQKLDISRCSNLRTFSVDPRQCQLTDLRLSDNPQFIQLPDSLLQLPHLVKLDISRCSALETLEQNSEEDLPTLPQLSELRTDGCCKILIEEQRPKRRMKRNWSRATSRRISFVEMLPYLQTPKTPRA